MTQSPIEMATLLDNIPELTVGTLEKAMMAETQVECPVIHRFGPGTYIREVFLPAGSLAIGHYQNFEHTNVFLRGSVNILNDDGSHTVLKAPLIFVGKPGRKIGYITEDVTWLNIYATDETDINKLEAHFLTKSENWAEDQLNFEHIDHFKVQMDHDDFCCAIKELGLSVEEVRKQAEISTDMTELPYGDYKIKVDTSSIEGQGLFATARIEPDEEIAIARIGGQRTIAGRYTNHSAAANAKMIKNHNNDIVLVATKVIDGCRGSHNGSEITIDYREAYKLAREMDKGA
jgi:hypothetical protein